MSRSNLPSENQRILADFVSDQPGWDPESADRLVIAAIKDGLPPSASEPSKEFIGLVERLYDNSTISSDTRHRLIALATPLDAARRKDEPGLREALVEAVMPLEVIAAQDRWKPYAELTRSLIDDINRAIGIVRAALATPPTDAGLDVELPPGWAVTVVRVRGGSREYALRLLAEALKGDNE